MKTPAAELREVHRIYDRGTLPVHALRGVDLVLQRQEVTAIMGPSGCGKTTLLNLLGLIDRPTSGDILLDGVLTTHLDAQQRAALRGSHVGFIFQQFNLMPRLTAIENVTLPLRHAGVPRSARQTLGMGALRRVGLGDRADHRPDQLSGGQQQRVAIARALVRRPPLLLADEPTGALDQRTAATVLDLLHELSADGFAVVVVTHDPLVATQAQRLITLSDGVVVSDVGQPGVRGGHVDGSHQQAKP